MNVRVWFNREVQSAEKQCPANWKGRAHQSLSLWKTTKKKQSHQRVACHYKL